jgi:hypothetical protein
MTQDEMTMEDCKATWRESSRVLAVQEAQDTGLDPTSPSYREFIEERAAVHYARLEQIGMDDIKPLP